jgi:hypothetical protein
MKRNKAPFFFLILLIFILPVMLPAQTGLTDDNPMASSSFDMSGFPQWARDLRRGEIIAFGAFPFMYFFSNFGFDIYRMVSHDWDRLYAPWPLKPAGAIDQTQEEKIRVLGIAAGGAIVLAFVDYGIQRHKRNRLAREIRSMPDGTPIIIRTPLYGEETNEAGLLPEP